MPSNTVPLNKPRTITVSEMSEQATCTLTGTAIYAGDSALIIRPAEEHSAGQFIVGASGLTTLEGWLSQLPDEPTTLRDEGGRPAAEYGSYAYFTHPCLQCQKRYQYGEAVVFGQDGSAPWCHASCLEAVVEAVGEVWSHTDRFITENL